MSEVKLEDVVIWHNIKIRIDGKTVFYKKWNEHGVFFLSDLFKSPGILLSYDEFKLKYAIKCHRLQYMGLIDALPKSWRYAQVPVTNDGYRQNLLFGTIVSKVNSRMIYTKLIENFEKEASCINSWKMIVKYIIQKMNGRLSSYCQNRLDNLLKLVCTRCAYAS